MFKAIRISKAILSLTTAATLALTGLGLTGGIASAATMSPVTIEAPSNDGSVMRFREAANKQVQELNDISANINQAGAK